MSAIAICANPPCEADASINGRRCDSCASYLQRVGEERPERLIRYPGRGHNLLGAIELCQLIGVTYRRVDWLIRKGRMSPTIEASTAGEHRGFDLHAATVATVLLSIPKAFDIGEVDPRADRLHLPGRWWTFTVDVAGIRADLEARWPEERDLFLPVEVAA